MTCRNQQTWYLIFQVVPVLLSVRRRTRRKSSPEHIREWYILFLPTEIGIQQEPSGP